MELSTKDQALIDCDSNLNLNSDRIIKVRSEDQSERKREGGMSDESAIHHSHFSFLHTCLVHTCSVQPLVVLVEHHGENSPLVT